ncbi:MAG: protein-glutamate O-methyltransferase CheR [Desulfobacterales bacterium]|nr:protein-glutamate O-methyltransferase CheR [Desulfobacterales bacterium]
MNKVKTETIELNLLLEAIYLKYGYDFRNYSRASIKRRVVSFLSESPCETMSALQHEILYHPDFFEKLLFRLSVNVTEMFRDPGFYLALKKHVFPELEKKENIKIWHAGCATGEEVYSLSILLKEEGLYDRCYLYATDIDDQSIGKAKDAIYPMKKMQAYTSNYNKAGGRKSFSDYYTAKYDFAILKGELKKNIIFTNHNLATDAVFGEMDLIICRNVLIYFNRELQDRALALFKESLCENGILCLGSKETIRVSSSSGDFEDVSAPQRIYRVV